MFSHLLAEHFVHTALWAGAVAAVVSGAIGVFVVARGMSFAVHAISELGFTGAAGALVIGINPVTGILGGSLLVGLVLGLLEAFAASYLSLLTGGAFGAEYKDIFAFSILILILIFRPKGLLGEVVRERA